MLSLLADENLDGNIVRGLLRRLPGLDLVRVQDVGLRGHNDPEVLAWAGLQGRILVTHDVETITCFAYDRLAGGLPMPGVIEILATAPVGQCVQELLLVVECCEASDLDGQILYLPL